MKKLVIFMLASLLSMGAIADDWKKLGEHNVSFASEKDTIRVSALKGKYDTIAFHVEQAPIFMKSVTVIFGNGKKQVITINKEMPRGKRSLPYQLINGNRVIKKIELDYKTTPGGWKSALVSVYGKKA